MEVINLERRRIFSFKTTPPHVYAIRPPWALSETSFLDACTRCGDCLSACPSNILIPENPHGYPTVDFTQGECTFCGDCVSACPTTALNKAISTPWAYKAQVKDSCLAHQQVICTTCAEQCEVSAIRFSPQLGKVAEPEINLDACTGCGACVAPCPSQAMGVSL